MSNESLGEGKTICIIEDEPAMIELVSLILRSRGFNVVGAHGGQEGLQLLAATKPDLVLLDLMMPDMSGWDVYQQMKADNALKSIPVIIVTAKAQSIDKVLGLHIAKVQDYITKPFSPNELLESIRKVLAAHSDAQAPAADVAGSPNG
jgi:DNA-binding response OmpR family regulator